MHKHHFLMTMLLLFASPSFANSTTFSRSAWGFSFSETFKAHKLTQGSSDITVAIIDTGVDLAHPLLLTHLWVNPGESGLDAKGKSKSNNGLDDDDNGYVDDVHGWNFANNTNQLTDTHGHGSHIAGIIAKGAPKASLMILKYFNPEAAGEVNQQNTVKAIEYAMKMKAKIINYSAGGTDKSVKEEQVIAKTAAANILFVAAAGNERANSDYLGFFPANYDLPNIVAVTAVDSLRNILPSSNFGRRTVHLAAPGKMIQSSVPGGKEIAMTGTSQATAFVTAAAVLVMTENPSLQTPESVIPYLTNAGTMTESLASKTKSGSVLNMYQSLVMKGSDLSAFGLRPINTAASKQTLSEFLTEDELPFTEVETASASKLSLIP